MIVRLHDGIGPGKFLFEGRDHKECAEFIQKVTPKHFSTDELRVNGLPIGYILHVEEPIEMKTMKKMQLVHLDITRAKQSTSREEYKEEFSAYMQREDCDEVDEIYGGYEFDELHDFDADSYDFDKDDFWLSSTLCYKDLSSRRLADLEPII